MAAASPQSSQPSAEDQWNLLFQQTLLYAGERVSRQRWRGAGGGVLPGGHDPSTIAAEALRQLWQRRGPQAETLDQAELPAIEQELRRLAGFFRTRTSARIHFQPKKM